MMFPVASVRFVVPRTAMARPKPMRFGEDDDAYKPPSPDALPVSPEVVRQLISSPAKVLQRNAHYTGILQAIEKWINDPDYFEFELPETKHREVLMNDESKARFRALFLAAKTLKTTEAQIFELKDLIEGPYLQHLNLNVRDDKLYETINLLSRHINQKIQADPNPESLADRDSLDQVILALHQKYPSTTFGKLMRYGFGSYRVKLAILNDKSSSPGISSFTVPGINHPDIFKRALDSIRVDISKQLTGRPEDKALLPDMETFDQVLVNLAGKHHAYYRDYLMPLRLLDFQVAPAGSKQRTPDMLKEPPAMEGIEDFYTGVFATLADQHKRHPVTMHEFITEPDKAKGRHVARDLWKNNDTQTATYLERFMANGRLKDTAGKKLKPETKTLFYKALVELREERPGLRDIIKQLLEKASEDDPGFSDNFSRIRTLPESKAG